MDILVKNVDVELLAKQQEELINLVDKVRYHQIAAYTGDLEGLIDMLGTMGDTAREGAAYAKLPSNM